jgi:hypothetical protein
LNDLENILLDSNSEEEEEDNDDEYDEMDNGIEEYDPLANNRKNLRRRNYFLGHMARMNFRRNRGTQGVGNNVRRSKYGRDNRHGR